MANENYSEKVSVNMNAGTLSEIDMLVDNGYFSNRSDFINHAVRESLNNNYKSTVERIIEKNSAKADNENGWFVGISGITAKELDEMHKNGEKMSVKGYGIFVIDKDCSEEKLFETLTAVKVRGKVVCSPSVKQHYGIK